MREFQLAASLRDEGNIPGAIQHLRTSLELDPLNAEAEILLGWIYHERGDLEQAATHLEEGVRLLEEQERLGSVLAEARNMLGLVYVELDRHDDAIAVLRASADDEMNTAPHLAYGNLGLAHLEAGHYQEALEPLRRAVEMQPRFCLGYYRIGWAHFELSEFEQAEEALVRAIDADPSCSETPLFQQAWRLRGETRARLGQREDAIADFERCVELAPRSEEGERCQGFLDAIQ